MKIRNKFIISKKNRIGVISLTIVTVSIILFPRIFSLILSDENDFKISSTDAAIWEFKERPKFYSKKSYFGSTKRSKYKRPKTKFDPNKYTREEWMNLGLSEKQVNVILKFTKRGIKSNEDLQRIFVISDELFELIKDSTIFEQVKYDQTLQQEVVLSKVSKTFELNQVNEDELMEIKGVGSFFAKQIIKKRTELGGFYEKEQLLEVWKMDDEKYQKIKEFVTVDPSKINKISINTATLEELKAHPYIRWNIANSIVKMRSQKNGFKSIEELTESVLITNEKFEKLKPYISL